MRSSWIIQISPKFNDRCPYKKQEKRHRYGGEDSVKTEAEIAVILPQPRNV